MAETTAQKPEVKEIASIARSLFVNAFGNILQPSDDTLATRSGGKGLKIYREIERDAHAHAVLDKRKTAVIARPWDIDPASESRVDKKAADLVRRMVEGVAFDRLCLDLLDANLMGYAVGEVLWGVRSGEWLPLRVPPRDQRRFAFTLAGEPRLLTQQAPSEGEELPPRKFIVHRRPAPDDSPYGAPLGSILFWPVLFKRQGIGFWLTFADKFGAPTAVGKYPSGTGKTDQDKLLAALGAIAQDAGVIVPEGMIIELLEASRTGTSDLYERLARYLDEQISEAVLGETMSTTSHAAGMGSNQAGVHNEVRKELAQADADLLSDTLNQTLVRWVVDFNMPGAGYPTIYRDFSEEVDTKVQAERDQILVNMGWEPSEEYIGETYGEGWTRKPPPDGPGAAGRVALGAKTPLKGAPGQDEPPAAFGDPADAPDGIDVQGDRLAKDGGAPLGAVISHLQGIVDAAESLDGLRDDLLVAYGHLPIEDLMMVMSRGFAAAEAAGRFDVSQGN